MNAVLSRPASQHDPRCSDQRIRILIITYEFPPSGGVAVQRALSFARYLPQHGFDVHVLTARNPASPVLDPGLTARVPPEVRISRAWTPEPPYDWRQRLWKRARAKAAPEQGETLVTGDRSGALRRAIIGLAQRALSPDPHILWHPFAYRAAVRLVESKGIDTVLTTAPPFSVFVTASRLKRRFPHLRMITDFRDEWRRYFLTDFEFLRNRHAAQAAEAIERRTIESSALVLAATQTSLDQIRRAYASEPASKFAVIANGYDPEAFSQFTPRPHNSGKLLVTYIGTAYKVCSPRYYLDALQALPEQVRSQFLTRLVGRVIDEEGEVVTNRPNLELLGFRPQAEALRWMEETDFLLVTVTNDFAIAGKLFEYLAAKKPILAISPPGGEVAKLVKESGAGWCAAPNDHEGIKQMLLKAFDFWTAGRQIAPNPDLLTAYARPTQVAQLAALIRGTSSGTPR